MSANNPLYYALVGWPSLVLDGNAGVYAMRFVSALLSAVFVGWTVQMAFAARRAAWMPAAVVFLVSPMIVYFSGAVNPQGLEVAAAAALWVVIVIGVCLVAAGWPATRALFASRAGYAWIAVCAASGVFSFWWTLRGGSLSGQAIESDAPLVNAGFFDGAMYMLKATPHFIYETAGFFGWWQ